MKSEDLMLNNYIEIEGIGIAKINSISKDSIEILLLDNSITIVDLDKIKSISIKRRFY